eukprot:CAMPEP_0176058496 /NCGR_PEP_ID=MMETSP0120_2-20121206/29145_1 /TAXON_ID=160619 /ORGANISM="Kryptoperidinium foliaceum, Strain CCMP 1326" /LENGTH=384 /DNA_ID=CAMNT_0017392023 /DNA_START=156 /DNA_END=1308 /DNA_ORIENTATION=+
MTTVQRSQSEAKGESALEGPARRVANAVFKPVAAAIAGHAAIGGEHRSQASRHYNNWPEAWKEELDPHVAFRFTPGGGEAFFSTKFKQTGEKVRMREWAPRNDSELSNVRAEVNILKEVQGPNVIALYDVVEVPSVRLGLKRVLMLKEFHDTDATSVIERAEAVSFETKMQLLADVLHGLERLAEAGVVHRDIEPTSLSIFGNCSVPLGCRLKIRNFESACHLDSEKVRTCSEAAPVAPSIYLAPEVYTRNAPADPKQDIWSAGMSICQMIFGEVADNWPKETIRFLLNKDIKRLRAEEPDFAGILDAMLAVDPEKRPTAAEALRDLRRVAAKRGVVLAVDGSPSTSSLAEPSSEPHLGMRRAPLQSPALLRARPKSDHEDIVG